MTVPAPTKRTVGSTLGASSSDRELAAADAPAPKLEVGLPARRRVEARPYDGAFGGAPVAPKPARPYAGGPVLGPGELGWKRERDEVAKNGGRATLCAYRGFDPTRPPVVLVHGIHGCPSDLASLAERQHAAGKQVFLVAYDHVGKDPGDSGIELAAALRQLRQEHYAPGTRLVIDAHSMGGIVTRAALNELAAPGWHDGKPKASDDPHGGFGKIRVRSIDTPWEGFEAPLIVRPLLFIFWPLFWLFCKISSSSAYLGMQADSRTFKHLFEPRLSDVDWRNIAAVQDKPDEIPAIPDFSARDRRKIARALINNTNEGRPRIKSLLGSLRQDARIEDLRAALAVELKKHDPATALSLAYDQAMPRERGTHLGVATDDPGRSDDLVDRLVREP